MAWQPRMRTRPQAPEAAAHGHAKKPPKPKEIPVPEVKTVESYTRDYLPTFKIPDTYIRGKGAAAHARAHALACTDA